VPAAGEARRFGGAKLLADIRGLPLLERTLRALREGGFDDIVVVLGPDADRLRAEVPLVRDGLVRSAINPDPSAGMLSSIQAGLAGRAGDPVAILPGDMPYVRAATVRELLALYRAKGGTIVSPRYKGKRGHPVLLPPAVAAEALAHDRTGNLHQVLAPHGDIRTDIEVDDPGVGRDVDTVGDLKQE